MTITEIAKQKKNQNRYSIFVDNKYCFSIDDIDLVKSKLKVGQELTNNEIDYYIDIYEYSKAKEKALNYIAFKKRTLKEVLEKLILTGFSDDICKKTVDYLISLGYINDEKFTESYINNINKLKPCGKKLIAMQLKTKGVNDKIIKEKLEQIDLDEYNIARNLIEKKLSRIKNIDKSTYRKLYSFLLRKGFSSSLITEVLKERLNINLQDD